MDPGSETSSIKDAQYKNNLFSIAIHKFYVSISPNLVTQLDPQLLQILLDIHKQYY